MPEDFASSFAFAETAVAFDSSSAADFVQRFAVVEVSSKTESERMCVKNLTADPNAIALYSSSKVPR